MMWFFEKYTILFDINFNFFLKIGEITNTEFFVC
jgi:hypothetical protein